MFLTEKPSLQPLQFLLSSDNLFLLCSLVSLRRSEVSLVYWDLLAGRCDSMDKGHINEPFGLSQLGRRCGDVTVKTLMFMAELGGTKFSDSIYHHRSWTSAFIYLFFF